MNRLKFLNIKNCVENFRFSVHIVLNIIFTMNTPLRSNNVRGRDRRWLDRGLRLYPYFVFR